MKYLSLFSGIEAASVAWHPIGWECVGVSEIEPFPCAVLAHHYPDVPNLGDVTKITEEQVAALGPIDLVVFGSPCQDLSLAGKRKGLVCDTTGNLTRSGLFFTAMQIIRWARKHNGLRFAIWENVPGAFSSNKGADFAAVVGHMAGLDEVPIPPKGWGTEGVAVGEDAMLEWCVLDAQWAGVAQRRRRCFALADFGDWFGRPPILLEPESLRGDSPPRREAQQDHAAATGEGAAFRMLGFGDYSEDGTASSLKQRDYKDHTDLIAFPERMSGTQCAAQKDQSPSLGAKNPTAVAYSIAENQRAEVRTSEVITNLNCSGGKPGQGYPAVAFSVRTANTGANGIGVQEEQAHTLDQANGMAVAAGMVVRRLTPTEAERLQGFPDGYTNIPYGKKPTSPDTARYKALGNSMATPVMHWIGKRISDAIAKQD